VNSLRILNNPVKSTDRVGQRYQSCKSDRVWARDEVWEKFEDEFGDGDENAELK